jgi:hypothetical protein
MKSGVLRYSKDTDRWCFCGVSLEYGLQCGEVIALKINDEYIEGRIEMDRQDNWYCIFRNAAFTLRRGCEYMAKSIF